MNQSWQIKNQTNTETDLLIYGTIGKDCLDEGNNPKEFAQMVSNIKTPILNIRINSCGGDLFAGHAIYTAIKSFSGKKRVYIDGIAASAASIISMAGDEIIMPSNTLMMIHNAQTVAYGDSKDFRKLADDLDKMNNTLIAIYQQKTGVDATKIQEMLDNETWLSANEALSLGFATSVTDPMVIVANIASDKPLLNGIPIDTKYTAKFQQFFKESIHVNNLEDHLMNQDVTTTNNTNRSNVSPTAITLESIKCNYAEIYNEIYNLGTINGTNQERSRIQAIDELNILGHNKLVSEAKYTNGITPEVLALQIIKAEKVIKNQYLANVSEDAAPLDNVKPTDAPLTDSAHAEESQLAMNIANKINSKGVR